MTWATTIGVVLILIGLGVLLVEIGTARQKPKNWIDGGWAASGRLNLGDPPNDHNAFHSGRFLTPGEPGHPLDQAPR